MQQVNSTTLAAVIADCMDMDEPLMVWGAPGIGKSAITRQVNDDHGCYFIDIRLANYDQVDLRGVPSTATGQTTWCPVATLPFKGNPSFDNDAFRAKYPKIIIMLDEITNAMMGVQAVAYQIVQDRAVGEHSLMDNVWVMAAGNRASDRGSAGRMALPLANRFIHVEALSDLDSWCKYAFAKGFDPLSIAFLRSNPKHLNTFDPSKPDLAFATSRTWEKACKIVARFPKVSVDMDDADKRRANRRFTLLSGTVGEGVAIELETFLRVWERLPNIDGIIMDPANAPVPTEADVLYSVCAALAHRVTKGNFGQIVEYTARLPQEFGVMAVRDCIRREPAVQATAAFSKWAVANAGIWQE